MKVTADTITDEQIRELRDSIIAEAERAGEACVRVDARDLIEICCVALYDIHSVGARERRAAARARCAAILSARAAKVQR